MFVIQLKEAGAGILGKNNIHEICYGGASNKPHHCPVRKPLDLERNSGGSGRGSSPPLAPPPRSGSLGTDTGGSIRIPSALCGVVGLKPTFGRVSVKDVIPLSPHLDCVGPLARTMAGAAIMLDPIFVRGKGEPSLQSATKSSRKGRFRLGLPKTFFSDVNSPEVEFTFEQALRLLQKSGSNLKEVSIPLLFETEDAGNQIAWAEATHYH